MPTDSNIPPFSRPEIWGGLECTINRVGDQYKDQLSCSGHYDRFDDISRFASLGIKCMRYPILWERHQKEAAQKINWNITASRLNDLRLHGITPIAGLLHHGSGPSFTSLDDSAFPQKFAAYAREVAASFPWLEYYTPINEPLTTARFSGLYGHWYPHKKNAASFLQMLVNQLKATVMAMGEIRKINPCAKLVQTEDLGKTHSTPRLQYQADFENERRWLTCDLLCGRVDRTHPMWNYLTNNGVTLSDLSFFTENPCPPDIMGMNYYVTSERWLDENISRYPLASHGGNETDVYADTEAVRARSSKMQGLSILLQEAWNRFGLPLALTETHLACTREEQLRWFQDIWEQSCALKQKSVPVLAVTAWALLGAYDWDSLLTKNNGNYESGVFDVSSGSPRTTALAKLITELGSGAKASSHLAYQPGWWACNKTDVDKALPPKASGLAKAKDRSILVLGTNGPLADVFAHVCKTRSLSVNFLPSAVSPGKFEEEVERKIASLNPWAIINVTGATANKLNIWQSTDYFYLHTVVPAMLAKMCSRSGIRLASFSSAQVFNGSQSLPYVETNQVCPSTMLGEYQAQGEMAVALENPEALIIRPGSFFDPKFPGVMLDLASRQGMPAEFQDGHGDLVSLSYLPDLANALLNLLIDEENGIWHLVNEGEMDWIALINDMAVNEELPAGCRLPVQKRTAPGGPQANYILSSTKGRRLPSLRNALDRYFSERQIDVPALIHAG